MNALKIYNPSTEALLREVAVDSVDTIRAKTMAAREAQPAWAARPLSERIAIIRRFRDMLMERRDSLSLTMTMETGKPIAHSRNELNATPGRIDFFLDHVESELAPRLMHHESNGAAVPGTGDLEEIVTFSPLGVVANISAWNFPYFVGTNVFIPALLTGNAVLYKPSEHATLTGKAIAGLLHEAGVPDDIFATIIGDGQVGAHLLDQPIDGVFFTGSYNTGVKVASTVAHRLIPTQLELGGKDPAYVADDVDPKAVAEALVEGAFYNNGQSCCAIERIYVHSSVYYAFRSAFVEATNRLILGDSESEGTFLGPVTRQPHLRELQRQVDDAVEHGATVLTGGRKAPRPGWYFEPTVLVDVNHDMAVMRDETFGPVIGIQEVHDDAEAIALMADTKYGLTASVYSRSRERATQILSALPTGTAYWNCCDRVSPRLPWTGRGDSGLGSTLSLEGIRAFIQPRGWHLRRP